jgi:hypothetical protein
VAFFGSQIAKMVMVVIMPNGHAISVELLEKKRKFFDYTPVVKLTA